MENNHDETTREFSLETVITSAVQVPGVKVNRREFLRATFSKQADLVDSIIERGPVEAGIDRKALEKMAKDLILRRTVESSADSFALGLPGGFAMAATIPADVMQFFGMALRLAQELSYLYGAPDLWEEGVISDERVKNQLILYCGVMFGASGAAAGLRVLTRQLAKTALEKLPQKALTKVFWFQIVKKIGNAIGIKVTKAGVAKGISKAIPVVGGVVSGGLNYASMMPMANRLQETLDKSCFDYSEEEYEADIIEVTNLAEAAEEETGQKKNLGETIADAAKEVGDKVSDFVGTLFGAKKEETTKELGADLEQVVDDQRIEPLTKSMDRDDIIETLQLLKHLRDQEVITEEEFVEKKKELLARI